MEPITNLEKKYLMLAERLDMYKNIYNMTENTSKLGREFHNQRNLLKREFKKVEKELKNIHKKVISNITKRKRNNNEARSRGRRIISENNLTRYLANQSRRNNAARRAHERALRFMETMNNNNENNENN